MTKNYISNKDETVRMFKNDFFEAFSRVHPAVPLGIYIPIIVYLLTLSMEKPFMGEYTFAALLVFGIFIWTGTEYFLHRFIFHYNPKGAMGRKLHFIFHGVHHDYPRDSRRLVMPPAVSIPLATLFYFLFYFLLGSPYIYPFFAGFLTGYLFYDMTHYAIHHFSIHNRVFLYIKKHHMKHHYQDPSRGFGVSQPMWDTVMNTDFEKPVEEKQEKPAGYL